MSKDFNSAIKTLAERTVRLKDSLNNEEATKTSLILPFIQALGYDVFDPAEVAPEFTADIGIKKGEKLDYAILSDNQPIILIECKPITDKLQDTHYSQLYRYFSVLKARFAILTNGLIYKFYTDFDEPNKLDAKPFLEINMTEILDNGIDELKRFQKSEFSVDKIISTVQELKALTLIQGILQSEIDTPSDAFITHLLKHSGFDGKMTKVVLEQYKPLVSKAVSRIVQDKINHRLTDAMVKEKAPAIVKEAVAVVSNVSQEIDSKIVTTPEELEAYMIVKTLIRGKIALERIVYRDVQTHFNIIVDDNSKKPICRLYLNNAKKYIGLFELDKKETRIPLAKLDDIFNHQDALLKTAGLYV